VRAFQQSELKVFGCGQRTRIGPEPTVEGCSGQGEVRAPEIDFYRKEERIGLAGGEGIDFSPNRGQHAGNEAGGRSQSCRIALYTPPAPFHWILVANSRTRRVSEGEVALSLLLREFVLVGVSHTSNLVPGSRTVGVRLL
jgi:hypothetical protein